MKTTRTQVVWGNLQWGRKRLFQEITSHYLRTSRERNFLLIFIEREKRSKQTPWGEGKAFLLISRETCCAIAETEDNDRYYYAVWEGNWQTIRTLLDKPMEMGTKAYEIVQRLADQPYTSRFRNLKEALLKGGVEPDTASNIVKTAYRQPKLF